MTDSICSQLTDACLHMLTESMQLDLNHIESELSSYTPEEQVNAISYIENLYFVSQQIKEGVSTVVDYNELYCESDTKFNVLQQGMFDAIKLTLEFHGEELWKELHTHTNRGGEDWFPIVIFKEPLEDYCSSFRLKTIYRGCNESEHQAGSFGQCWSSCKQTAIDFAFNKYPELDYSQRRVYQAEVSCEDIIWIPMVSAESEVVIKRDAKLENLQEILPHQLKLSLQAS
ncbi:hypothetical protein J8L86_05530 [Shewanella sp. MMG014]|uniref:hypothetical protein n=1 Tax=Shewanella sp. MMG014 TaxID=2822691 RepID=UPI001B364A04|nr:hypothetical protein [Shewanella sp. MMG014]MBQ4889298.1 hypothetical protein [Shewanella sp. MMG014]